MADLTDIEENLLPIPLDWMKAMDPSGKFVYKNSKNQLTSSEHPFISQGSIMASKLALPPGWVLKESHIAGPNDPDSLPETFFFHVDTGRSGW